MPRFDVRSQTPAPIETVWKLLQDGRSWPEWSSSLDELVLERSSGIDPDGRDETGAVRAFRTGRIVTGERLTAVEPPHHLAYADEFNLALRDYQAHVRLSATEDGGTAIHWTGDYRMKPPAGWFLPVIMPRTMQQLADDLAARATQLFNAGG